MAKQSFVTGQVLTAAQLTSLQQTAMLGGAASAKTASYTLVAADAGTTISMTSTSATTITVNTGLFAAGDTVFIQNLGAGVSTITPGTATVNTSSSLALAQYEGGTLFFTSASASLFFKADGSAASSGALTKITSASFTTQSSVSIPTCFSATYKTYYVVWYATASVSGADMQLQFIYAGPTTQTSDYFGAGFGYDRGNTLFNFGFDTASAATLYNSMGSDPSFGNITFSDVGNASQNPIYFGTAYGRSSQSVMNYSQYNSSARTYTGFLLKPDSGTITGRYAVYGLEN